METDGPGSENSLVAGKRKREPDRDEVDNLEELIKKLTEDLEELELDKNSKQVSRFRFELDPPESVKNDDEDSIITCKPAASPVAYIINKFENMNKISVKKDGGPCSRVCAR